MDQILTGRVKSLATLLIVQQIVQAKKIAKLHITGPSWGKPIGPLTRDRKTSSISRTKSQSLNVSCILLQVSSLNPLKPGV